MTQNTNDSCYRAQISLAVNNITIVDEITDSCNVSGFVDNVQEYNVIFWKVDVPKTYTNLPYYKVSNGTVRITSAVMYQAALTEGYTIKIDDTVHGLTGGEIAAIVIGSLLGILIIATGVVTYFCTHQCFWIRNVPVKKVVMVETYQPHLYLPQQLEQ